MATKSKSDTVFGTVGDTVSSDVEAVEQEIHQQESRRAVWSDSVDIPIEQLQIPFLQLMQGLSKPVADEKAKSGEWYVEGYPPTKTVTIVPLQFGVGRTFMEKDEKGQNSTSCYSPTGVEHGIAMKPDAPAMPCGECPLSKWTPNGKFDQMGRPQNDPPACKESYDFMCWSVEHNSFVKLRFRGTGMKPGRTVASIGRMNGLGNFAIELGSIKDTNSRGQSFAVPTVELVAGEKLEQILATAKTMYAISG